MPNEADSIASVVLRQFDALPPKRKPAVRDNGIHEWVPLSGIVAKGPTLSEPLKCLALATGMKCLPTSKLPSANGGILHDWHAEVLAIRAFNHFVLEECKSVALGQRPSEFLRPRSDEEIRRSHEGEGWHGQPFAWRDDITIHMYCSEAPCGDASMELTMAAQDDASPWEVPAAMAAVADGTTASPAATAESITASLPGRGYFSQLGVVRRKPARGDAPQTLSKSCSDKLALRQCTSLLSSLTSLLVAPAGIYVRSLVLPASQRSPAGCTRAFSAAEGRMRGVAGAEWPGGYAFRPFTVATTDEEFQYSKRVVGGGAKAKKVVASNLAVAWSKHGLEEGIIGGVLQGRKQSDPRGASLASRRKMWGLAFEVAGLLGAEFVRIQRQLSAKRYQEVKDGDLLAPRRKAKEDAKAKALSVWVPNDGDSQFGL